MLAVKLIEEQEIDVLAVSFVSAFFGNSERLKKTALKNDINLKIKDISRSFLEKVAIDPKHGYGKNMNPCIDCKIFMIKEAFKMMKKEKANFVFTGEVLGQRPMSQKSSPIRMIQKESGSKERLLRPLSAKLLPITEPENKGWVKREELLDIAGRGRRRQLELASKYGLEGYSSPSGGCLLTEGGYSRKFKDLLDHQQADLFNASLLKTGRHFRVDKTKLIAGRNEDENKRLENIKRPKDIAFKSKNHKGPVVLLAGPKTKEAKEAAARLACRYTDPGPGRNIITFGGKTMEVEPMGDKELKEKRII